MKKQIIIPYFPRGMKYAAPFGVAAAIYLTFIHMFVWAALLLMIAAVIWTTKYVTELDLEFKRYKDYLSLLGIPLNVESKRFNKVDRIIITKGNYAQTVNTRVQSRQMSWSDYTGTLIFDTDTIDLLTRNDKHDLVVGLKDFAVFLNVGVEDRTTNRFYWIDLSKV